MVTFRGIPPISLPGIVCLSAHASQYMVSGLYEYRFQTEVRAHFMLVLEREPRSENRSMCHKNVENLKMKVDQIPSLLFSSPGSGELLPWRGVRRLLAEHVS
jgi:hypothetical protein